MPVSEQGISKVKSSLVRYLLTTTYDIHVYVNNFAIQPHLNIGWCSQTHTFFKDINLGRYLFTNIKGPLSSEHIVELWHCGITEINTLKPALNGVLRLMQPCLLGYSMKLILKFYSTMTDIHV